MKRKLLRNLLFLLAAFGSITASAAYCTSGLNTTGNSGYFDISAVSISSTTLNNTAVRSTVYANTSCLNTFPASGATTAILMPGNTYTLNVTTTENCIISVWIDYNQNGTFETTEWTQVTTSSSVNVSSSATISIPSTALLGTTGLRIRSRLSTNTNDATSACLDMGSGCTEDYTVTIGNPTPAIPVANFNATSTAVTMGNSIQFNDNTSGVPTSWSWSFPGGTPSTSTLQNPTVTYNTLGSYNVTLQATNSLGTNTITKTAYINVVNSAIVPSTGLTSISTCGTTIYDNGGVSSNYALSSSGILVVNPGTAGNAVKLVFNSFYTESGYDYLYVYNGTSTSATLLGTYSGSTIPASITATNSTGALTLKFTSDGSSSYSGFEIATSCVPLSLTNVTSASWSSVVDNDADGYAQSKVLNYSVSNIATASATIYTKVYYKLTSSSTYTLLNTSSSITIPASSTSGTQTLSVTSLTNGSYDFKIEVYTTSNTLMQTYDLTSDIDLQAQKFELASSDVAGAFNAFIYHTSSTLWLSSIDNNGNSYAQSRVLKFDPDVSSGTSGSVYGKIYSKLSSSSTYTYMGQSPTGVVSGTVSSDYLSYTVSGLAYGLYDFKIELYDASTNSLLDTYSYLDNTYIQSVGFEPVSADGTVATNQKIYYASWTSLIDNNSNGYTQSRILNYYSYNSGSTTSTAYSKIYYKLGTASTYTLLSTSTSFTANSGSYSSTQYYTVTGLTTQGSYDFRIELYDALNTLLDTYDVLDNTSMSGLKFESATADGLASYCMTSLGGGAFDITAVSISSTTLNNSSTRPTTTTSDGSFYTSFVSTGSSNTTTLTPGSSYSINVTTSESCIISAWIDFNQDNLFSTNEWVQISTSSTTGIASSASIIIPSTALVGQTRLRIRSRQSGNSNSSSDACSSFGTGCAEDYLITIGSVTPTVPVANFTSITSITKGQSVAFSDLTTGVPTSWNWTFEGGTPTSSTTRNPVIVYNTPGIYKVILTATNSLGTNTITKTAYITVNDILSSIYSVSLNNTVDNDGDYYNQSGKLSIDVDVTSSSSSVTNSLKVYVKSSTDNTYSLYKTVAPFLVTGSSTSDAQIVDVAGLPLGIYTFYIELYSSIGVLIDNYTTSTMRFEPQATDNIANIVPYLSSVSGTLSIDNDGDYFYQQDAISYYVYSNSVTSTNVSVKIYTKLSNSSTYTLVTTVAPFAVSSSSTASKIYTISGLSQGIYDIKLELYDASGILIGVQNEVNNTSLSNKKLELPATDVTGSIANNGYLSSVSWSSIVDVDNDSYSESRILNVSLYTTQNVNATVVLSAKSLLTSSYIQLATKPVALSSSYSTTQFTVNNLSYGSYDFQIDILDATGKLIGIFDQSSNSYLSSQQFEGGSILSVDEVVKPECTMYPNPASDVLTVSMPGFTSGQLIITDMLGKIVLTKEVSGELITENVGSLSGIYFVTLVSKDSIITKKVIVKN
jgi:PKD repeat protein